MAELVLNYCIFCAGPIMVALIAAFVHRKNLKIAKVISSLGYMVKIKEAGLTNEAMPLIGEDETRLKNRHSVIVGLVLMPIECSVLGSFIINTLRYQNDIDVSDIIVNVAIVLGILLDIAISLFIYRMVKQNNDWTDYTKRRGVCLDLVEIKIGWGVRRATRYYATVGYISDDGEPVVFELPINYEIYYAMRYAKGWFVVVESNNRNMNVISEKSLDEMVREDRANGKYRL